MTQNKDLYDYEIELLIKKYTVLELAEQLKFYKDLENVGNVYYQEVPQEHHSLIDLIKMASPEIHPNEMSIMLDMKFTNTVKSQFRKREKYNINKNLLRLAIQLSQDYKAEHSNRSCPRVKNGKTQKSTHELLNGKSGSHNTYPGTYVKKVKSYLKKYPLKHWCDFVIEEIEGYNVIEDIGELKYQCIYCEKILKKKSRNNHKKICKGKR
jgi:hypothetical protein